MKAMLARWRAAPGAPPPGYRPGATAVRVLADLSATRDRAGGANGSNGASGASGSNGANGANGVARLPNGVRVSATEQVARQFLMHTVSVRIAVTARGPAAHGSARVLQTGWLRRTGVRAAPRPGCDPDFARIVDALLAETALADALRPVHLADCAIDAHDGCWTLTIVPYGGSEVVNRMPSFRRYVRLTGEQAAALSAACAAFDRVLRGFLRR
ncbi:DUF3156 family protein [Burkholderia stagnalis]|uniref:DUF3156 family protein n=1 Tax=Burkholderia stagnalis TaxID=1503054 RepID=UPI000758C310|nr:DUF3156 family protein [Burkholderia stagnalis]KVO53973.1 hypothetical protein WT18_01300 [Burkholderia stagnalis]KVP07817.1 hypothetical protein WT20_23420 [Burkholderia stagnalis]KVW89853.1 hypothetical protein WT30_28490 [Burkholderia stagnalis]KWH66978.1 hypothetical protein WT66_32230 [Burkholderia stagnalis]KWK16578.1 hypothetical protein WT77_30570 [Burkholderia stagnalis]